MRLWLLVATELFVQGAACSVRSEWDAPSIDEGRRRWVSVYRDASYRIFVDTAHMRIDRPRDKRYLIWYRTEHRTPHIRHGRKWNREVSQAIVSCTRHQFKVIQADLSLGDAKPISRQRASPMEVDDQPWHEVPAGTPDAASLRATCWLAEQRYETSRVARIAR